MYVDVVLGLRGRPGESTEPGAWPAVELTRRPVLVHDRAMANGRPSCMRMQKLLNVVHSNVIGGYCYAQR